MKRILFALTALLAVTSLSAANVQTLTSPDGGVKVEISTDGVVTYNVFSNGRAVMQGNRISMDLGKTILGVGGKVQKVSRRSVDENIYPALKMKFAEVRNRYNELTIKFKEGYSLEFRAFDDGYAYRFVTALGDEITVFGEKIGVNFSGNPILTIQQANGFYTSYEEPFTHVKASDWKSWQKIAHLPILAECGDGCNVLISESALSDYPGAFFQSTDACGFTSVFPKLPVEFGPGSDRSISIVKEAEYIARTSGNRAFPWRYFIITKEDGDLLETTMPVRLAEKPVEGDFSWVKPGQVSWEWWNGASPYGPDVDFVTGCNLETYKYYIDFAAKYGIDYILLDEGWANSTLDPFTPNPGLDLHELIRYGKEKNVGLVLWLTWLCAENNPSLFEVFEKWGISGVKIDFMDRSDQWMVNFYERTVAEAAKHHLFVDFHGAYKPSGLEYKYPNLLSYEGVLGMEQMERCKPENSIYLPFTRNVTGAMEYTPGAMLSMQPERYAGLRPNSASIGTRAYQMALFVVFESGLQMLADNPTLYFNNDDCTRFMTGVPVLWDETVSVDSKLGDHVLVAKRSGQKWFVGGITAERKEPLALDLTFDFLPEGKTFTMTSFEDGVNAGWQAMHYVKNVREVKRGDVVKVKMVRNGGFAAVIE